MKYDEKLILDKLCQMQIAYDYISHPPVFTSDAANQVMPDLIGARCKNLFVRDRANRKYLLVIPDDKKTDLKYVAAVIGSSRLSFCNEHEMMECLGVSPGSVTPLAVINDTQNQVVLYIDTAIMNWDTVLCHPMINTATIRISRDDFEKFIAATGHEINIRDLA